VRAGEHHLVDLTLTHLRQLVDVEAGLCDVVCRYRLCPIASELVEAVEYRTQLRECVEGATDLLQKFEALLVPNSPSTKPPCSSSRAS
jgi:hypothetical protein